MSTIANLLSLIDPGAIKPFGEAYEGIERGRRENETGLLELARAKQQQSTEARAIEAIQNDPELRRRFFGDGSILGSIGPAGGQGGPPAPGPMTQQQVMPGQPPGTPQTVPGGQDLSQFATQGGAPQSTIGSLGPAGQPQGPPQRNPLLEMAAKDPRAAMMLQQQLEGRQDAAMKRQEQNLKLGAATLGYVGQQAQGVTDQASLDALRSDLQSQGLGKYAAQLPQLYSKDAMQPFIAKALDVEKSLTLQVAEMKVQADNRKTQADLLIQKQRMGEVEYKETPEGWIAVPKYPGAQEQSGGGVGGTAVTVGGQPAGSLQGQKRLDEKQQQTRQAEMSLQGEYNKLAKPYMEVRDAMGRIEAAGTSPTAAGDAALLTAYMKMLDPTTGVRNEEIRNAENVGGLPQRAIGWLEWLKGGAPLKEDVRKDFMDRAKKLYEQYQKDYEQNATQYREQATRQGLDPRNVVQDYRSTTPGGGRSFGKPVGEMSREELLAERDRLRKGGS